MICVRIIGGLGNQLFQYATGRALALRHGCELLLDVSHLQTCARHVTPRQFELDHFRYQARVATAAETRHLAWLHRVPAFSHWVTPWRTYVERGLGFNASFAELPDDTYLVGYWQSPQYFASVGGQIAAELSAAQPLSPESEAVAEAISRGPSVMLHVRRGDYVTLTSAATLHGTLGLSYYEAALQRVREQVEGARYFVFSDDIAWCREHLPLDAAEAVYVGNNTGANAWQDLLLMARCHHHIIANSSFSWWGAWLADQRFGESDHMVIAPSRWFAGKPGEDLSNRFPAHWVVQP
jgi:hypothetical protein